MVARMAANTKYSVNKKFIQPFVPFCDRKMTRGFTHPDTAPPWPKTPLHPLHFPGKDQPRYFLDLSPPQRHPIENRMPIPSRDGL
jgi:hypothetical protein